MPVGWRSMAAEYGNKVNIPDVSDASNASNTTNASDASSNAASAQSSFSGKLSENGAGEQESVRDRIVRTAWNLFYRKGFEKTTVNDILREAGIAKGTFYYYFRSKDRLLDTLPVLLDEKYRALAESLPEDMHAFDQLMYLNAEVHDYIGKNFDYQLIASLYSAQLLKEDEANLLDQNRYYFRLITKIIEEGQRKNELVRTKPVTEIVRIYSLCERALVTDWCMHNGSYSLGDFSREYMPILFGSFRA